MDEPLIAGFPSYLRLRPATDPVANLDEIPFRQNMEMFWNAMKTTREELLN